MRNIVEIIKKQFLSGVSIPDITKVLKDNSSFFDWDQQEQLINATILCSLNVDCPLKTDYQIAFLKTIIHVLEDNGNPEIHDVIYEQLAVKLKSEKPEFSYKHFVLDDSNSVVTVKESNSFIRDGTTGLKLWPAAMALAEFILQNRKLFKGKSILELGSGGTGFVGLVLVKACEPEKVFLSDCHDLVLNNLAENIDLNLVNTDNETLPKSLLIRQHLKVGNGTEIGVLNLPWEDIETCKTELMETCRPNIILAADVVYDDSIFVPLIVCIEKLFKLSSSPLMFYLSQTIRNPETFEKFCEHLKKHNFTLRPQLLKKSQHLHFQSNTDIQIFEISEGKS